MSGVLKRIGAGRNAEMDTANGFRRWAQWVAVRYDVAAGVVGAFGRAAKGVKGI